MAPSTTEGSPALGRQVTGMAAWPVRCRRGSNISAGPVAQLSPIRSTSMASRAHRAAPISVPGSMVPVSSMVTWVWMGTVPAGRSHRPPGPVDGRLGLQQVEHRLDEDEVDAALDERRGLLLVGVAEVGVPDLAEGGELGARADAPGHPPGPVGGGEVVGRPAGQAGRGQVQLADPVGLAVLGQHRGEGAEGVGLDHIAPDLEERPVDPVDDVGPAHHQQLVAPLELGTAEVVGGQLGQLEVGAHGAVEDDHPLGDGLGGSWTESRRWRP